MKKTIISTTLVLALGLFVYFYKHSSDNNSLKYSTTTSKNMELLSVEQNEKETRLNFKLHTIKNPYRGFQLKSNSIYIQNSKGGKKIEIYKSDSLQLNRVYKDTIIDDTLFSLVFPPLDKTFETIDFISENTRIFDIELTPQKHDSRIPQELVGSWLKTDGSNEWDYGFYNDLIIYKNEFWNDFDLNKKGSSYVLTIKKEGTQHTIRIKKSKKGKLFIGKNLEQSNLFSRDKTYIKDYVVKEDPIATDSIIFKEGVAIYKGYINGYHPKMKWIVGIYPPNVITGTYPEYSFDVNDDGTFYAEVPMNYAERTLARIGNLEKTEFIDETVYLKPEKTTVQIIHLDEYTTPYKSIKERIAHQRKTLFMGDLSQLNSEMKSLEHIRYRDHSNYDERILSMTPTQHKEYYLSIKSKENDSLNAFIQSKPISQLAYNIKKTEISFRASDHILAYEQDFRGAKHIQEKKNKGKKNKEFNINEELKAKEKITSEYYDFLELDKMKGEKSLILGAGYYFFMNKINRGSQFFEMGLFVNYFEILANNIKKRRIALTGTEQNMINALTACKTSKDYVRITRKEGRPWKSFQDKYDDLITESRDAFMNKWRDHKREELFGEVNEFEKEIIFSQNQASYVRTHYSDFNASIKKDIESNISNKHIKNILLNHGKTKALEYAENVENVDYSIHNIPKVKNSELFKTILKQHKGKVVLVDFWATWCGPCISGMEKIKSTKERLKDNDIEFIYITSNTSPLKSFDAVAPGIKGHHYRLNKEQWAYLITDFGIKGIPRYMFVDKRGNIIEEHLATPHLSGDFEKLLNKYL